MEVNLSEEINLKIRQELVNLSEENYREFSSKLLPGVKNILGVRLPNLRRMAKEIAKDDWRSYLNSPRDYYFEEIILN